MKVYFDEDFEKFPLDHHNNTVCPEGDYSRVKNVPACCVFGQASVVFGNGVTVGPWCLFYGNVTLGSFCTLERRAHIQGKLTTGKHCRLGFNCRLEGEVQFGLSNKVDPHCEFLGRFSDPTFSCFFESGCELHKRYVIRRGFSSFVLNAKQTKSQAVCTEYRGIVVFKKTGPACIKLADWLRHWRPKIARENFQKGLGKILENRQTVYPGCIGEAEVSLLKG